MAAGPSRIPQRSSAEPSRRITRSAAQQSDSDAGPSDLPYIPTRRTTRHRKTPSFSTLIPFNEDDEATPRARARTQSFHSRRSSYASTGTQRTSVLPSRQSRRGGRKLHIRPSLAGEGVRETTVDERTRMIASIAGDCVIKLLSWDERNGKGKAKMNESRKCWELLRSKLCCPFINFLIAFPARHIYTIFSDR